MVQRKVGEVLVPLALALALVLLLLASSQSHNHHLRRPEDVGWVQRGDEHVDTQVEAPPFAQREHMVQQLLRDRPGRICLRTQPLERRCLLLQILHSALFGVQNLNARTAVRHITRLHEPLCGRVLVRIGSHFIVEAGKLLNAELCPRWVEDGSAGEEGVHHAARALQLALLDEAVVHGLLDRQLAAGEAHVRRAVREGGKEDGLAVGPRQRPPWDKHVQLEAHEDDAGLVWPGSLPPSTREQIGWQAAIVAHQRVAVAAQRQAPHDGVWPKADEGHFLHRPCIRE
mmetsp:Transcript_15180/g.48426  ORF Transcript_15180/g.48426 Transcript_15180/m.48426 type:complete len:286 (+) Transcript_15180:886-1743(+)